MARYFFDVTDIKIYLRAHSTLSGIQRVSLEIIKECVEREGPDQVRLCVWEIDKQEYHALSADFMAEMDGIDVDTVSAVLYGRAARPTAGTSPVLARYRTRPVKYQFHRLIANLQSWRENESYFAKRGSSLQEWRQGVPQPRQTKTPEVKMTQVTQVIEPGDQLVILGATWGLRGIDKHMQKLRDEYHARISLLIHDLIPVSAPHHLGGEFSLEFYRWLEKSTQYACRYFVATNYTKGELEKFMDEVGTRHPVTVIPFARKLRTVTPEPATDTFKARCKGSHHIPLHIRNRTKVPYVLVVGTMESRKNLWRLAQAWDRLTQDHTLDMPKLMFAGRFGWSNEDLMDWMRASGNLNGWVQFVETPTDEELTYLYRHCLFTATVSLCEGWGLPIGESLGFGKTAVVANNTAMPEVGGDLVEYCEATSINSIADACRRLIADPARREELEAKIRATRLRTWDDVAQDYIAALVEA
jgi:glycosyltransferase involved in cell wall biosynthesis